MIVVKVVLGEANCANYRGEAGNEEDVMPVDITEREFKTQEEADAYLLGLSDMDGWLDYEIVN